MEKKRGVTATVNNSPPASRHYTIVPPPPHYWFAKNRRNMCRKGRKVRKDFFCVYSFFLGALAMEEKEREVDVIHN
jgi:hypothetical protein